MEPNKKGCTLRYNNKNSKKTYYRRGACKIGLKSCGSCMGLLKIEKSIGVTRCTF